jgi:tight adherence protein C
MTFGFPALLVALCAAMLLAVSFAVYGLVITPNQPGRRLGILGLMRVRSLQRSEPWAAIEPLVRWMAARVEPFVRGSIRDKIDRQVMLAGDFLGLQADEYVALCILSSLLATAIGMTVSIVFHKPALVVVVAAAFGATVPYFHISGEANTRLRKIQRSLPYAIDLISLSLTAGLDFPGALRQVMDKATDVEDYLMREFAYILHELNLGKTRKQAMLGFSVRAPCEIVYEFVSAIVQAEERGNPLAQVLMIQAESARQRRSVRGEEAAASAGIKMIGPCLCIFLCVVMLIGGPMLLGIEGQFGVGNR